MELRPGARGGRHLGTIDTHHSSLRTAAERVLYITIGSAIILGLIRLASEETFCRMFLNGLRQCANF